MEILGNRHVLARIFASSPDQDSATAADLLDSIDGQPDVVTTLLQRIHGRETHQTGITMQHSIDLNAGSPKRRGRRRNHGIGCRSRPTGKQDRHFLDVHL